MTGDREPRDVEARLRASLSAYAEAVDDQPAPRVPVAASARSRSPVRGWRAPALVAAAVLAVTGGVWLLPDRTTGPSSTAAPAEATVLDGDSRAESGTGSTTDSGDSAEGAAGSDAALPAEVGVAHPLDLYTHCGIFGADVGGVWFAADPPLVEGAGPPAGWGDPYQPGTLTLESTDEAVFRDDAGHELSLRAAPDSERPPPCD